MKNNFKKYKILLIIVFFISNISFSTNSNSTSKNLKVSDLSIEKKSNGNKTTKNTAVVSMFNLAAGASIPIIFYVIYKFFVMKPEHKLNFKQWENLNMDYSNLCNDCFFCSLIRDRSKLTTELIYQDDKVFCFRDQINYPKVHLLIIPKIHLISSSEINEENSHFIARIFEVISILGKKYCPNGYRVVNNNGSDALQSIHHIHFHILGGQKLCYPFA